MDFEKELSAITAIIPPEYKLADETTRIALRAFEAVDHDYGLNADFPLDYHNAPHSVGSVRRGVRIAALLLPYMKLRHSARIFDLTIVTLSTHDRYQLLGQGVNESASTDYACEQIEAADGILNTKKFKKRVELGHQATVVAVQQDGSLAQINLRRGSRDPIKVVSAYGDTGGIGMEGKKSMVRSAVDLYNENCAINGREPSDAGRREFMSSGEIAFIRGQFSEEQVKATIAFYFPDNVEEIYRQARRQFHGNIVASFRLAEKLGYYPELDASIGRIVRTVDPTHIGTAISRLVGRKFGGSD